MSLNRIVKGVLATATVALVTVPAGLASAAPADNPPPAQDQREAAPQSPDTGALAAPCRDVRQVGSTMYLKSGGKNIASLKHFYSKQCDRHYGYIWVWKSFRDQHKNYRACAGLKDTAGRVQGLHCRNNLKELWSYPVHSKLGHSPYGSLHALKRGEQAPQQETQRPEQDARQDIRPDIPRQDQQDARQDVPQEAQQGGLPNVRPNQQQNMPLGLN